MSRPDEPSQPNAAPSFRMLVRDSLDADMAIVERIYSFYVLHSLATFEERPPAEDELRSRRAAILDAGLPYLVAEADGQVMGYAYATAYRARPAYRYTVEDSVYVAPEFRSRGAGRALLAALMERSAAAGRRQMVAVIGDTANHASIALHRRMGFEHIGTLKSVGFKFGGWVDTVLMQHSLGARGPTQPA